MQLRIKKNINCCHTIAIEDQEKYQLLSHHKRRELEMNLKEEDERIKVENEKNFKIT